MLALPSPPLVEEYDGVPLVYLHDDAKDVKALLQTIYDPSYLPYPLHAKSTPLLSGLLKLAMKYEVDFLRNRIVQNAIASWPRDLAAWDKIEDNIDFQTKSGKHDIDVLPNPVYAIRIGRDCNIPEILPLAYYALSWQPTPKLSDSVSRFGWDRQALSREELEIFNLGKEGILTFILEHSAMDPTNLWMCGQRECSGRLDAVLLLWREIITELMMRPYALLLLRQKASEIRNDKCEAFVSCVSCRSQISKKLREVRKRLFEELPNLFQVCLS
ncbi:hypothetical protein SERLA73DRAFT_184594 [Serpula lacrymans var. lacrymans S7.3]|uniref:BTB domain-containing protein n=2 Tax=Serpula lacrymans var. lacrymans TaxID=341189 RepID=F8Q4P3_SERL3|nr:uncharacterized protein SERLADRAFT_472362 [Serpula lacrymans var. lacrymans S7.9]EGN96520.1 hypothetical protein SERLA73DRAFT_184594 [Serpula lacrymans var. lacrymans S7.3]EGO22065.1 hypothetical protein SERLADRAFT_472362 [Serpula lacrymans var. lacrymans S7.9]